MKVEKKEKAFSPIFINQKEKMAGIGPLDFTITNPSEDFKTVIMKKSDTDNDYEMNVWLYADPAFDTWVTNVKKDGAAPTENEKEFADQYSSYTLTIYCKIKKVATFDSAANRAESGCCLRDETQKGGGYCMKLSSN